jgi:hypothetical protein
MTKYENFSVVMGLFACWCAFFFGVLMTSPDIISLFYKHVFVIIDTFAFVVVGMLYFSLERFREYSKKRWKLIVSIMKSLAFWIYISIEIFDAISAFYVGWEVWFIFYVNSTPVVTFYNLESFVFISVGILLVVDAMLRMYRKYRKIRKKQMTNP